MDAAPVTRRLAAIVVADVVGYTRLMERDEAGTHARLLEIRREVTDLTIARHGGRIVKTAGDGMLLEFPSAASALLCAIDVQRDMGRRNLYVAADQKIEFRIGINVGDIIIDGDDIAGDGVNVAARMETLATPGGICIASSVHDQVHGQVDYGFEDIGEQQVKNIVRPIRVYRVKLAGGETAASVLTPTQRAPPTATPSPRSRWLWPGVAAGVVALAIVATVAWRALAPAHVDANAKAGTPPALSIAVLPFTPPSASAADQQLSNSLAQDVTTSVARIGRNIWVVSFLQSARYKDPAVDIRTTGRELNVRYIAQGSFRHDGNDLSATAVLVDAADAKQVWSDTATAPVTGKDGGASIVIAQLAKSLRRGVLEAEGARVRRAGSATSPAELALRGHVALTEQSLKGAQEASDFYDQALKLDPNFGDALVGKVWALDTMNSYEPGHRDALAQQADEYSLRAIAVDSIDPRVWIARADALMLQFRWAEAEEALMKVARSDPQRSDIYLRLAWIDVWNGRPTEGLVNADKAVALDPREADGVQVLSIRCRVYLSLGQYEEAIQACERSVAQAPDFITYVFLTAAYAQTDQMDKAAAAKARLFKIQPNFTISRLLAIRVSDNAEFWAQTEKYIFTGLRKAGIADK